MLATWLSGLHLSVFPHPGSFDFFYLQLFCLLLGTPAYWHLRRGGPQGKWHLLPSPCPVSLGVCTGREWCLYLTSALSFFCLFPGLIEHCGTCALLLVLSFCIPEISAFCAYVCWHQFFPYFFSLWAYKLIFFSAIYISRPHSFWGTCHQAIASVFLGSPSQSA